MKNQVLRLCIVVATIFSMASCSLDGVAKRIASGGLIPGASYEIRAGLRPNEFYNFNQPRGMCYVLRPSAAPSLLATSSSLAVRTTAYCHSEDDHLRYGRLNAVGTPLKYGTVRSAAADWSRYPLGTRFRIKGQPEVTYVVDDYGSALVGSNTIDIYCTSKRMMNNWGVKNLNIEVVKWGSFDDSLEIMSDRVAYSHVRRMVQDIRTRLALQPTSRSKTTPATAMMAPRMLLRDI